MPHLHREVHVDDDAALHAGLMTHALQCRVSHTASTASTLDAYTVVLIKHSFRMQTRLYKVHPSTELLDVGRRLQKTPLESQVSTWRPQCFLGVPNGPLEWQKVRNRISRAIHLLGVPLLLYENHSLGPVLDLQVGSY